MKMTPSLRLLTLVGALAFVLSAPVSRAVLLNWDLVTWTPGALTQSFDIDPGNLGNDVTITVSGNTSSLISSSPFLGTTPFDGGNTGHNALQFLQNFTTTAQSITVTVDFHYGLGVTAVNYSLFDIDKSVGSLGTSVDQIRGNVATLTDLSTAGPTTFTGSVDNTITGAGLSQVATGTANAGNLTSDGNVTTTYNGLALNRFVFTYGNDATASGILPPEGMALGNIDFTPVPEAGTVAACAVFSLLGAWGLRRMRKAQPSPIES